jgi:cbb3-type cytochrome oxidase subunit 1/mono/diheme cytochrome c family protein
VIPETATDAGGAAAESGTEPTAPLVIRLHLMCSSGFLVAGSLLAALAALELVVPDVVGGTPLLGYGRLVPAALHFVVYGWLTLGLLGALYLAVSGDAGVPLRNPGIARLGFVLLSLGYLAGGIAIGLGFSEGRRLLEAPLWADAVTLLGLLIAAVVVTRTVAARTGELGVVQWYAVAAVWWLVLLHLVGNIPGVEGVGGALQASFYRAGFFGLWLASAGVGAVYALLPRLGGRTRFTPTRLSLIGFWTLGTAWALTGSNALTYGPVPAWLQTIGVVFSIALLLAVATVVSDVVIALRGRWDAALSHPSTRFLVAGLVLFALVPLLGLLQGLRASSAVIGLTEWAAAYEWAAIFGAFTLWLLAFGYEALPRLRGRTASPRWARIHLRATVLGLGLAVGAMLVGGVQAGLTWIGEVNSQTVAAVGTGFRNTLEPMEGLRVVRFAGVAIFALAQLGYLGALVFGRTDPIEVDAADDDGAADAELVLTTPLSWGRLRAGAAAVFVLVLLLGLVLPSLDSADRSATALADTARHYQEGSAAAAGREVYLREGCATCHTQQVRPIVTDVGLGAVSVAGDYAYESPVVLGVERIGPDLTHAGSRSPTNSSTWVVAYLQDPRQVRSWSVMPSYDSLSFDDLRALAAYLRGLR